MNLLLDLEILGWLLVGLAGLECIPIAAALISGEPSLVFIESALTALVFGLPVALSARSPDRRMRIRDGFLVVSGAWVLASVFGSMPYLLTNTLSPVDALFESVSGFTTTGSTVLTAIESTPRALLLWRSLTQWVGGMGIIVFAVAVLHDLKQATMSFRINLVIDPNTISGAKHLTFKSIDYILVVFPCLYQIQNNLPGSL